MAVVARVEAPTIGVDPLPNARVTANLPLDYAAPISQGLESIGNVAQKIADDEAQKANIAAMADAQTRVAKVRLSLFDPANPDGIHGPKNVGKNWDQVSGNILSQYDASVSSIGEDIRSPAAKERFREWLQQDRIDLAGTVQQHALAEKNKYTAGVQVGFESTRAEDLANRISTGDVNGAVSVEADLRHGIAAYDATQGIDPAVSDFRSRKLVSDAYKTAIAEKLGTDPLGAVAMFKQSRDKLLIDDRIALQAALKPQTMDANTDALARQFYGGGSPVVAVGDDSVYGAFAHVESGGRQYAADGAPLLGPKTKYGQAVGAYQIMPSTGPDAAKLAGVAWNEALFFHHKDGTAADQQAIDYNAKLGQAYIDAQLKRFGGDVKMAAIAYNWGPENAAKWQAAGSNPDTLPDETKAYVPQVVNHMGGAPVAQEAPLTPDAVTRNEGRAKERVLASGLDVYTKNALLEKIAQRAGIDREKLAQDEQAKAQAKLAFHNNVQDINTKLQAGYDVPVKDRPTIDQYKAVYGDDAGQRAYDETQLLAQLGPDVRSLANASPADASKVFDRYKSGSATPTYEFAKNAAAQKFLTESYKQIQQKRDDDPAGYVIANSRAVKDAASRLAALTDAAQKNPALASQVELAGTTYADALRNEQLRQGVPANKVAMLSKPEAEAISGAIESKLKNGDVNGAIGLVRSAVGRFGAHGGDVIPQLGKDASGMAVAVLENIDARTIGKLGQSMQLSDDDRKKQLGARSEKIDNLVSQYLAPLAATSSNDFGRFYDMTRRIAGVNAMEGMTDDAAAQNAAAQTVNNRYVFAGTNVGPVRFRIPNADIQGHPIDTSAVLSGADAVVNTLTPDTITMHDPLPPGVDPAHARQARVNWIQGHAHWQNVGHETGLMLTFEDESGRTVPLSDQHGRPFVRTWTQLQQAADANSPSFFGGMLTPEQNVEAEKAARETARKLQSAHASQQGSPEQP